MAKKAQRAPTATDREIARLSETIVALEASLQDERRATQAQYDDRIAAERAYEAEVARVKQTVDRNNALNRQLETERETKDRLKAMVANQGNTIAEQTGVIAELRRQIDQAAPKIMVTPAVFASPAEAAATQGTARHSGRLSFEDGDARLGKHWTAL